MDDLIKNVQNQVDHRNESLIVLQSFIKNPYLFIIAKSLNNIVLVHKILTKINSILSRLT